MTRIRTYVRRHHLALLCLLLIATGSTAYAAGALPKNSVASKQIKNNTVASKDVKDKAITSKDIRDRTVGSQDLAAGLVPQVSSELRDLVADSAGHEFRAYPGFGTLSFSCSGGSSSGVVYSSLSGVAQAWSVDIVPLGGTGLSAASGGTGGGGGGGIASSNTTGRLFVVTAAKVLSVDYRLTSGTTCRVRATSTIVANEGAPPPSKTTLDGKACRTTGRGGYCLG